MLCEAGKRRAFHGAAGQRVLQNTQVHALLAGLGAQLGQIANRNAAIFGYDDGLGFSDLRRNLSNDGLLIFNIKWHG